MRFVVEAGSECKGSFYFLFVFHIKREAFPRHGKGLSFYVVDFCLSNHRDISSVQEYFFVQELHFNGIDIHARLHKFSAESAVPTTR